MYITTICEERQFCHSTGGREEFKTTGIRDSSLWIVFSRITDAADERGINIVVELGFSLGHLSTDELIYLPDTEPCCWSIFVSIV